MLSEINFGHLPCALEIETNALIIQSIPNTEIIEHEKWVYPTCSNGNIPQRMFSLPLTHKITFKKATCQEKANLYIWVLSFILGMRLSTENLLYLDAAPIRRALLVDFYASQNEITQALNLVGSIFEKYGKETNNISSAINALFLSHIPQYLEYEQFGYLYMALDSCYALHKANIQEKHPGKISHPKRISCLQKHLGLAELPFDSSMISQLRNELFHEARYFNNIMGLSLSSYNTDYPHNLILQLQNLVSRLIAATIVGKNCNYVKSKINSRNKYELVIPKQ